MLKNTETKQTILLADKKSRYDEMAKRILGSKIVTAYLLSYTLEEFRGVPVDEIQPFELISKYAKCSIEEVRQVEETMLSTYVK